MAQAIFNDVVLEQISGTEPEDDADAFVKQVEQKIRYLQDYCPLRVLIEKTILSVNEHFLHLYFEDRSRMVCCQN